MRKIIESFIKYGIYANIVIAITVILGLVAFFSTKKAYFPESDATDIRIQMAYPGASPEEVEQGITQKVEEAIESVIGIDNVVSTSSENGVNITIEILAQYSIDEVFTEVKNAVDGISSFPVSAEKPIIYKVKPRQPSQWIGLSGDVNIKVLKEYADQIEDDLLALPNISQINVIGFPEIEISIEINEEALLKYGFTFNEIAATVRSNNLDLSAGTLRTKNEEVLIRSKAKREDIDKISEIILRAEDDGSKILLRDVANIKEQFVDQPFEVKLDSKPAVYFRIDKLGEEDIVKISEDVIKYVDDFNAKNNAIKLEITFDFYELLKQRLDTLSENFGLGIILVIISLSIFLNLRLSLWVAWGIPASFLGMFILASFIPTFTINMISLFGMILVVGILVDDGIVIAENIYTHFEKGKNPYRAAIDGTLEVFPAVTASVTTTIVAFLPMILIGGDFVFLAEMAIVVIFSLGFSLLEAFLVLPAHLASAKVLKSGYHKDEQNKNSNLPHIRRSKKRNRQIRYYLDKMIAYLRDTIFGKALNYTIGYKWLSLSFIVSLFIIVIGLLGGGVIKFTFFPKIEFSSLRIEVAFKPGTREDKVKAALAKFDEAVWKVNNDLKLELGDTQNTIRHTFSWLGSTSEDNGSHAGTVNVFYKELDEGSISSFDLRDKIKNEIGTIPEAEKLIVGGNSRWGKPIDIRLTSKNSASLEKAKDFLKVELGKIEEIEEIKDNVSIGKRELEIELNKQAYFLGFSHNEIASQIRQGFFGEEVQRLQKGSDEVRVWVRYPNSSRESFGQLENLKIKSPQKEYQLSDLTNYTISRGVSSIKHYDASKTISVDAQMVDPDAEVPPVVEKIRASIIPVIKSNFEDVAVELGGQSESSSETMSKLMLYLGGAFFIIFIIIMITFKSFYQAILIIMMIPLGWIGAILGHGIENIPVSLLSIFGMIALSGVIINDAVVFLDKYNRHLLEGYKVKEAAFKAGINRFRPIMLTSLTTVLGLLPLIKETSFQAQFLIPMATSIAYGVLIGTLIILLFFPVFIIFFNDVRYFVTWYWNSKKPNREDVERAIIDVDKDKLLQEEESLMRIE